MGFYVDGKWYFGLSVNGCFFGVNIDLLTFIPPGSTDQKSPIMHLIINGYEFGQGLRILLWIGMPVTLFLMMVSSWLHYRRSRIATRLQLSMEGGIDDGGTFSLEPEDLSEDGGGDGRVDTERSVKEGEEDYKDNLYKGILWMKEKYEQYRDLADERYDRLKEQLTRMEKKYEDLLAKVQQVDPGLLETASPVSAKLPASLEGPAWTGRTGLAEEFPVERGPREFSGETEIVVERAEASGDRIRIQELEEQLARTQQRFDEEAGRLRYQLEEAIGRGRRLQDEKNAGMEANRLLEQQVLHSSRQLEEKQRMIADLEGQLTTDRLKIDELVTKLRNNSQLLMNIYMELDKSLHFSDTPPQG
jgi:hypothetical protein